MNWTVLACSAALACCLSGCGERGAVTLKVFHAGSLAAPFREMEIAFEQQHPHVDVRREAYGSADAIRQVTELGRRADVIGSADCRLIDRMMIEAREPAADWNILFARNAIGMAYADPARAIETADIADVLARPGVRFGMSDPNRDPCGYRSLFCVYLAEVQLGKAGLFEGLVLNNSNLSLTRQGGAALIRVPSDVAYGGALVMRPKEVDLLALLEVGAIDYAFIYRSVARRHGLGFVELPEEANLGSASCAEQYGTVRVVQYVDLPDRSVTVAGSPIVYGLTIPRQAPQPGLAGEFVRFVLSEPGRDIMSRNGQHPLDPAVFSSGSRTEGAPFDPAKLSD